MALFTSEKKYFEVTAVSFTPDIMTVDEEISYSITVKNISGKKITSMYSTLALYYPDADGRISSSTDVYMYGGPSFAMKSISWASGASKTFTGKFKFTTANYHTYLPKIDDRLMPVYPPGPYTGSNNRGLRVGFTTNATFNDGTNNDYIHDIRGANSEYLKVIDSRYTPIVTKFSAERSIGSNINDEGENLLVNMSLSVSQTAKPERLSLYMYYRDKAKPNEDPKSVNITKYRDAALAGNLQTVIEEVLGKNSDWDVVLWFGDQYESGTYSIEVAKAFANVHLSGSPDGGVCFGSFSKSTPENPLFQCYYPAEFDKGIKGGFTYESEEVRTGGKWIDGKSIYRRIVPFTLNTTGSIQVIATIPGIDTLINIYGNVHRNGTARYPITFIYTTSNYHSIWMENATDLVARTTHAIGGHVILEYTTLAEEVSE